jgi:hypothetical protein
MHSGAHEPYGTNVNSTESRVQRWWTCLVYVRVVAPIKCVPTATTNATTHKNFPTFIQSLSMCFSDGQGLFSRSLCHCPPTTLSIAPTGVSPGRVVVVVVCARETCCTQGRPRRRRESQTRQPGRNSAAQTRMILKWSLSCCCWGVWRSHPWRRAV